MLYRETVAVYCENRMAQLNTLYNKTVQNCECIATAGLLKVEGSRGMNRAKEVACIWQTSIKHRRENSAWKLRWMSKKWTKFDWQRQGSVADCFGHSNRLQSYMKFDG